MKFILFGTGPGLPVLDKGLSSIHVEHEGRHFLLDTGEGCSHQLLRHGLSGDVLDAVLVSHYHPDHISGIFMLIQMLYLQRRAKDLHVFLPERENEFEGLLQFQYTFPHRLSFRLLVHPMEELNRYFTGIDAMQTDHLQNYRNVVEPLGFPNPMRSWAFRIGGPGKALVYSADIQTTDCIRPFLEDIHSLIVDAMHPPVEQILKLADVPIPRVLLTHGLSPELEDWLAVNTAPNFELAQEDFEYRIDE